MLFREQDASFLKKINNSVETAISLRHNETPLLSLFNKVLISL